MEQWKDIDGYNGKYQVSNFGEVRSFSPWSKGRTLKGGKTKGNPQPYRWVALVGKGRSDIKTFYIHKLVAKAFLPNPNNYDEVNHKDGNTLNNHVDNLEWCTHKQNMEHASRMGSLSRGHDNWKGKNNPKSKAVLQLTKDGEFVKEWGSVNEIMRETGIPASTIFRVCNPKYKHEHTAHGYIWRYKDGETDNTKDKTQKNRR